MLLIPISSDFLGKKLSRRWYTRKIWINDYRYVVRHMRMWLFSLYHGVLQGSALSPLLFRMTIRLTTLPCSISKFKSWFYCYLDRVSHYGMSAYFIGMRFAGSSPLFFYFAHRGVMASIKSTPHHHHLGPL